MSRFTQQYRLELTDGGIDAGLCLLRARGAISLAVVVARLALWDPVQRFGVHAVRGLALRDHELASCA
jgi:hypothetical protein